MEPEQGELAQIFEDIKYLGVGPRVNQDLLKYKL